MKPVSGRQHRPSERFVRRPHHTRASTGVRKSYCREPNESGRAVPGASRAVSCGSSAKHGVDAHQDRIENDCAVRRPAARATPSGDPPALARSGWRCRPSRLARRPSSPRTPAARGSVRMGDRQRGARIDPWIPGHRHPEALRRLRPLARSVPGRSGSGCSTRRPIRARSPACAYRLDAMSRAGSTTTASWARPGRAGFGQ